MSSLHEKSKGCLYLSLGEFEGRATWHYLLVDKLKLPLLLKEAQEDVIDVAQYGRIVLSGFGKEPPQEVQAFVQQKYGTA